MILDSWILKFGVELCRIFAVWGANLLTLCVFLVVGRGVVRQETLVDYLEKVGGPATTFGRYRCDIPKHLQHNHHAP